MRRTPLTLLVVVVALGLLASPPAAAKKKKEKAAEAAAEKAEPDAPAEEKKKKKKDEKAFADMIEDFEKIEGLFTFYRDADKGKVFLEILPEQLDTVFLCSITRVAAEGWWFDSSAMLSEFPIVFHRVGDRIQFLHKNVYFQADPDAAIRRAIGRGLSDSLMGSSKIVSAPHPERGSLLVDPTPFFVQDIAAVDFIFKEFIKDPIYSLDRGNSYLDTLRSFPENSEIDAVLYFGTGTPRNIPTLADSRSFRHVYHYSLSSLTETSFKPRVADDRVGHFLTMYQDFTSQLTETPYVRYVNRWHLEKAEPKFARSKPRQPIVFWLENTIPVEYRDAVREGILVWNTAFEPLGFEDAIEVRQMPDDAEWDPADVRYNTVRWIVQPGAGYAVGPSRTNPFTGQIYDADIRVSADMMRYVFQSYEELAQPVARGDEIAARLGILGKGGRGRCRLQSEAAREAAFGASLLAARGIEPGSDQMKQYLHDFVVHVMAHEVGHTLGLRHNFKASTIRSTGELGDRAVAERGITGSVMDYTPVNLAPDGASQGAYWQTVLGPYDLWAIEYAYRPYEAGSAESEKAMLERVASRAADSELAYGTDEDAFWGARGMDPTATRWDLGADSVDYYSGRVAIAHELWSKMEADFETEGRRYQKLRDVFQQGIGQYATAVGNVSKYVGGVFHHRDHVGDPGGRLPFEPVPATRQRQALDFLTDHVFGPGAFAFPRSVLNKLQVERLWDFSDSLWEMRRLDYPIHEVVLSIQSRSLGHLYDPVLMGRMVDWELREEEEDPLTLAEMFDALRGSIWSELDAGGEVNSFRRNLQRLHLDHLTALVVGPAPGTPQDASSLARADLTRIAEGIRAHGSSGDAYTEAHLEESLARIEAALEAGIERQLG